MQKNYHIHISADASHPELKLRETWQYRDLIWLMVQRAFKVTYKQTVLGPLWIIIQPLTAAAVYAVVFGVIADIGTNGIPTYLFYLFSHALWNLFSSSLNANTSVFTSNAYIFGKVYFPRLVIPVSNIIVSLLKFMIQMLIVSIFLILYEIRGNIHPHWICLPVFLLQPILLAIMGMSLGLITSGLTTKFRDPGYIVSMAVILWMYGTPIVYPLSQLKEGILRTLIMLNPVTAPVELSRYILLGSGTVLPLHLIGSVCFTLICFFSGLILFNTAERTFIDRV